MSIAESFGRSGFARFMNSPVGRVTRILIGVGLISWGYVESAETTGIILMVVGLVPLAAGVFNLCVISALLGGPVSGAGTAGSKPQS